MDRVARIMTVPSAPSSTPLLRQRNFVALWTGQLISIVGDRLTYLGFGGLLLDHTRHGVDPRYPTLLALQSIVMLAPVLLLAPFTGAYVDRWNLKRVLIVSDMLRAGVVALIPLLYAMTHHTGPAFALVFLLFTCNVFFLPARSAITPDLVTAEQLLAANALLTVAGIVATVIGAIGGGWVVDHWGWPTAIYMDSITYVVSVATLALVRYRAAPQAHAHHHASGRGYLREVRDGWLVVRTNPMVRLALIALGAVWIGGGFLQVAGNPQIQRAAGRLAGMERVGLLLGALGLGSALGTWWLNRHARQRSQPLLLGGGLLFVAGGLVAFAVTSRFAVFAASAFVIGIFAAPAFMLSETLIQVATPPEQRGRVFSARDFIMRFVFLIATALAAPLTRLLDTRATLLVCATLVGGCGALALVWGRRQPELQPEAPA